MKPTLTLVSEGYVPEAPARDQAVELVELAASDPRAGVVQDALLVAATVHAGDRPDAGIEFVLRTAEALARLGAELLEAREACES